MFVGNGWRPAGKSSWAATRHPRVADLTVSDIFIPIQLLHSGQVRDAEVGDSSKHRPIERTLA